jgi:fatty acid amide hydrolase
LVPPSQAVARAVREAGALLGGQVRSVSEFAPPRTADAVFAYFAALTADAGVTAFSKLEGGSLHPVLESMRRVANMSPGLRGVLAQAARLAGQRRLSRFLRALGEKPVSELWRITAELRAYRFEFLRAMDEAGIDVLLCPAHATAALPHGMSKDFVLAGSTSILFNVLQMPAGVVPVARVRPTETRRKPGRDLLERRAAKVDAASAGLPVGVQVVARPWREDVVLAVMAAIEDGARKASDWPRTPTCA